MGIGAQQPCEQDRRSQQQKAEDLVAPEGARLLRPPRRLGHVLLERLDARLHHGKLGSDCMTRMVVAGVSADSKQESKFVPAAVVVCFVDAYANHKQAHDECDGSDNPMPKAAEESCGFGSGSFVFRV